jgi:hypothetical protein
MHLGPDKQVGTGVCLKGVVNPLRRLTTLPANPFYAFMRVINTALRRMDHDYPVASSAGLWHNQHGYEQALHAAEAMSDPCYRAALVCRYFSPQRKLISSTISSEHITGDTAHGRLYG